MKFLKKNLFKIILITFLVVVPVFSFAQTGGNTQTGGNSGCNPADGKICNPLTSDIDTVQEFIHKLLEGVLKIGIPLVALAIIYCGFLFVAARGNPESIKKAKSALLYTLIGAAILLGSWAIAKLISETVLALD